MKLIAEKHFEEAKFSLYFLATPSQLPSGVELPEPTSGEAFELMKTLFHPVIELTHNHGTEDDPAFCYHNGNTEPRGFGHVGFLVDDVYAACEHLEKNGVSFQKKPDDGKMKGLAFALDPDNYWVEIIPRGFTI